MYQKPFSSDEEIQIFEQLNTLDDIELTNLYLTDNYIRIHYLLLDPYCTRIYNYINSPLYSVETYPYKYIVLTDALSLGLGYLFGLNYHIPEIDYG